MLTEIWRQLQIESAQREADAEDNAAARAKQNAQAIAEKVDAMALANQAIFEILAERLGVSQEDVLRRMREIDLRDGRKDGKMGGKPIVCRKCGRTTNTLQKTCVYCGELVVAGALFQKI
jgi:predicted Zn-ribbon and HTH transcriptional regulator